MSGRPPHGRAGAGEAPADDDHRREHDALVEPFFGGLGLGATPDPGIEGGDPPAGAPSPAVALWRRLLAFVGLGRR